MLGQPLLLKSQSDWRWKQDDKSPEVKLSDESTDRFPRSLQLVPFLDLISFTWPCIVFHELMHVCGFSPETGLLREGPLKT